MKLRYATLLIATAGLFGALSACSSGGGGAGPGLCTPLASSIDTATSLPAGCYTTSGDVSVNAPLTLAPGVTIAFAQDSVMDVNAGGSLHAVGSSATGDGIVFEGATDTAGFWGGINVYAKSPQNDLEYVEVRDAGSATIGHGTAVWVASGIPFTMKHAILDLSYTNGLSTDASASVADIHLQANTYRDIGAYPVSVYADAAGALDPASVYSNTGKGVVEVFGGNVATSQTWHHLAVPYEVDGQTFVDAALTIDPGTTIQVDPGYVITVGQGSSGTLTADGGSASTQITFTTVPGGSSWGGITMDSASNLLNYVVVDGADGSGSGEVWASLPGVTISNSTFENSPDEAICWNPSAQPTTSNLTFNNIGSTSTTDCLP
ncbi:MAG: hypothetical protein P8Y05_07795 [Deinococcales bacterium]|jgi:hypothetical protein